MKLSWRMSRFTQRASPWLMNHPRMWISMNELPFKSSAHLFPVISSCYLFLHLSQFRQSYLPSFSQPGTSSLAHFSLFSCSYVSSCSRFLWVDSSKRLCSKKIKSEDDIGFTSYSWVSFVFLIHVYLSWTLAVSLNLFSGYIQIASSGILSNDSPVHLVF